MTKYEHCRKCGMTGIMPKYTTVRSNFGLKSGECLKYSCACGYTWTAPTLDAKPDDILIHRERE